MHESTCVTFDVKWAIAHIADRIMIDEIFT